MQTDTVNLHWIWRETMNKLTSSPNMYKGRDLDAASNSAEWLSFSGLIDSQSNAQDIPFKVDGSFMQWTVDQLVEQCNERFRTNSSDPNFKAAGDSNPCMRKSTR